MFFGDSTGRQKTLHVLLVGLVINGNTGGTGAIGSVTIFCCEMLIVCLCCMSNFLLV